MRQRKAHMAELWDVPESCRTLPGENLEARLNAAKELIQLLRDTGTKAPTGNRREEWTRWIKENLYSLFDRSQYGLSPAIADSTKGEYLTLDITVEERNSSWRIVLAVESELDDSRHRVNEILKDFDKLLAVKSAYKLMIYSSQKRGFTNEEVRRALQKSLDGYGHHIFGETYVFVDYNEDSGENGSFIAHTWQPCKSGAQVDFVPFAPLELP
jgi:hypothetical protein